MSKPSKHITVDFIRHGEPEGGDIVRGRVNPALTPLGWAQMRSAVALDARHQVSATTPTWTHVISSPLLRCSEFAERTAQAVALQPSIEDRWQEIDYGDWDGMPAAQWRSVAADQFRAFREDITALAPPNGESFVEFQRRINAAWQSLEDHADGSHLLVVTHGGVLRVVLPTVLGMPLNRSFPLHIPFACLSRVQLTVTENKTAASLIFHNGAEYASGERPSR